VASTPILHCEQTSQHIHESCHPVPTRARPLVRPLSLKCTPCQTPLKSASFVSRYLQMQRINLPRRCASASCTMARIKAQVHRFEFDVLTTCNAV